MNGLLLEKGSKVLSYSKFTGWYSERIPKLLSTVTEILSWDFRRSSRVTDSLIVIITYFRNENPTKLRENFFSLQNIFMRINYSL